MKRKPHRKYIVNGKKKEAGAQSSKRRPDNSVTLDFDGHLVTPEAFRRAVNAFVDLVREVSREISGSGPKLQWNISVASGSRLVIAKPVADPATRRIAREATIAIKNGIQRLEGGATTAPIHFTELALRATRELGALQDRDAKTIDYVRIRANGTTEEVTEKAVASAVTLVTGQHQALGCIEGKLQTISERGSFQFVVWDDLFDRGVCCFVDQEMMSEAVKYFGKRIAAFGIVQYDRDGRPVSIAVQRIKPFPEVTTLPPIKSLRGIFKKAG
ncbi:MAG: hypothetical protein ACLQVY_18770 [Limisphaerales bacterium]